MDHLDDEPTESQELLELARYARSADATAQGVADRLNRLDHDGWESAIRRTERYVPLVHDGRIDLGLGNGDDTWSVLWWDRTGRKVIGRLDSDGNWSAEVDPV